MNPISKATSAIFHPVQTASAVAGQTLGVAAAGVRTTMRILDRAAGQVRGDRGTDWSPSDPTTTPEAAGSPAAEGVTDTVSAKKAPAKKAPARKAPARKAPANRAPAKKATRKTAKKAPSARAATVAPALSQPEREVIDDDEVRTPSGIPAADEAYNPDTTDTDLHQPGTAPLMDPATVKAIKSEAEVMQRAADPDKG